MYQQPALESDVTATVAPIVRNGYLSIAYTWLFEGEPQEGLLILGAWESGQSGYLVDSFHMGEVGLLCKGSGGIEAPFDVRGSYAVPEGPDWGWRMTAEATGDTLRVMMYNITPDGDEYPGFELALKRA
jgi:hypothetical protein